MSTLIPHKAKNELRMENMPDPKLYFTPKALFKMQCYIEECDKEVGWLGRIRNEGEVFLCDEVFLIRQEVASATTEITSEGLVELIKEIGFDENETLRLWGHSHVNMGTGASGQDDVQMKLFQDNGCDWFFRIIANKRGEMQVTMYNWKEGYVVDDMQWSTLPFYEEGLRESIKAEVDDKVKELQWGYGNYAGCYGGRKKKNGRRGTNGMITLDLADISTEIKEDFPFWAWSDLSQADALAKRGLYSHYGVVKDAMEYYGISYDTLVECVQYEPPEKKEESTAIVEVEEKGAIDIANEVEEYLKERRGLA